MKEQAVGKAAEHKGNIHKEPKQDMLDINANKVDR
jgi:hypothetical protein